jgi:hypothetical protein
MTHYVLEPGNPYDFSQEELGALAAEITERIPAADISVKFRNERGYGVSLVEVIRVWTDIADAVKAAAEAGAVIALAVGWMRSRWRKDRDDHPDEPPRPRSVMLYGPGGEVLRSVRIDAPDGAPMEEESEGSPPLRPPHGGSNTVQS